MQAEAYFEESPVCPFVSHGRGINAEPVVLNFFLCLVEGEIAYANLVVKIVFDLILIPSTTVRNRRIVGFRPQIPRVFRIAAEFERNQMVLFIVPRVNFAMVAKGMGVYSEGPITDPKDLGPAIQRAMEVVKRGEPALVDALTQPR